jgi:hypothetical protein
MINEIELKEKTMNSKFVLGRANQEAGVKNVDRTMKMKILK